MAIARALEEFDAYPAFDERGYGWEKLMSETFCQEYWEGRGRQTRRRGLKSLWTMGPELDRPAVLLAA